MFEYDRNLPQNKIGEKKFFWVEDHLNHFPLKTSYPISDAKVEMNKLIEVARAWKAA